MGRFILALILGLLLGGVVVSTEPSDQGKKKQKAGRTNPDRGSDARVAVHVVFATGDVAVLRHHYAPRYRNLPPGLQKKVSRGGALPPGWQKKFEPFPTVVERELHPLPDGYRRGVIDGHAVIFDSRTKVIVDVAVLF